VICDELRLRLCELRLRLCTTVSVCDELMNLDCVICGELRLYCVIYLYFGQNMPVDSGGYYGFMILHLFYLLPSQILPIAIFKQKL
jgi:hypothetical protein